MEYILISAADMSLSAACKTLEEKVECHDKKATVTSCNAYVNRTEANKTDQQRYDEEQAAIDRETARKLKQREQEAKMDQLPSESRVKSQSECHQTECEKSQCSTQDHI